MTIRKFNKEELELAFKEYNEEQLKVLSKSELRDLLLAEQVTRKELVKAIELKKKENSRLEDFQIILKKKSSVKVQKNQDI